MRVSKICALGLALLAPHCLAETIQVTAWNLQEPLGDSPQSSALATAERRIQEAAATLQKLDPDVILLQQVRDWQMCEQLAQALKPADYNVLVCSSFRDPRTEGASPEQVAILSKRRAYFSWSQPWRQQGNAAIPGGFAFAAIQIGKQKVGFFSVQLDDGLARAVTGRQRSASTEARVAFIRQWAEQLESFRNWTANRIEAVVVAGGFATTTSLSKARGAPSSRDLEAAATACLGAPLERPLALPVPGDPPDSVPDSIRLAVNAESPPAVIFAHSPATYILEFSPVGPAGSSIVRADAPPPQQSQLDHQTTGRLLQLSLAAMLAAIIALAVAVWALTKRRPALGLPPPRTLIAVSVDDGRRLPLPDAVVVTPRSVTGSGPNDGLALAGPIVRLEAPAHAEVWQQRALAAEQRVEQANAMMRHGLITNLSRWLKAKLLRRLISDRAGLLRAQEAAAQKVLDVDDRLTRVELQIQQQNQAYQRRIEELTRQLIAAREESRELIRAQIAQVKAEMETARARLLAQANSRALR